MGRERAMGIAIIVAALTLSALGAPARAQQAPSTPGQAPAAAGTLSPAPADVVGARVVTGEQIAAIAATGLGPALALVPSLALEGSGDAGSLATLTLRGSTAPQVLLLLDGRPVSSAPLASLNFNDLPVPLERVERIEVLPSPTSVVSGSSALGGIVNIVTHPPGLTPGLHFGYGAGSESEEVIRGGAQYGLGRVGLSLDGRLHTGDGHRENSDFDLKTIAAGLALEPSPWGFDLRYRTSEREAGSPGPFTFPSLKARSKESRDALRGSFTYRPGASWEVSSGLFTERQTWHFVDTDPPDPDSRYPAPQFISGHTIRSQGFDLRWAFDTGRGEVYTVGGDWASDEIKSAETGNHDADRWGLFAQDLWRSGNWTAVGAIRRDDHSVFGQHTNPALQVAWASDGWKLWGGWSRNTREPDFRDLYWREEFFQGNPELVPERAQNYEGGVQLDTAGARARLTIFRRTVRELIRWADDDGDFVFRPENVDRARIAGWEAEAVYHPTKGLALPLGYQLLSVEDEATGRRLPGTVRSIWRAALESTGGSLTWSLEYAVTDRGEFQHRAGNWRDAALNAAISWNTKLGSLPVRVSLRGENLQDRARESVEGYPLPGKTFFTEVQIGL